MFCTTFSVHPSEIPLLVVSSDSDEVHLMPLRKALQEHPDGSLMVLAPNAPTER
jgi:hypothetical protein